MDTTLQSKGSKLFLDTTLADVWFAIDNEEIPGHKLVLALACPHFQTMLYGKTNEAKATRFVLKDTKAKYFKEVLRFSYSQDVVVTNWTIEDLIGLLTLAHEYQHKDLVQRVSDVIEESVSLEVLNEVFAAASLLNLPQLVEKCMHCAESNVEHVLLGSKFKEYSVDLVCALFERPAFLHKGAEVLFAGVSAWSALHSESELRTILSRVDWNKVPSADVNIIMKELILSHPQISKLSCWDTLKSKGERSHERTSHDTSHESGGGEMLTCVQWRMPYGDPDGYTVEGPVWCHAERQMSPRFQTNLILTFKPRTVFVVKQVKISGILQLNEVRFNDELAEVSCLNLAAGDYLARFSKPVRALKERNVLVLEFSIWSMHRVCVYGHLL